MGYSLSWYAVRGKTPQESCKQFGLHDSGCGISHLKMEGELPPGSGAIRDRIMAKQQPAGGSHAEVDCAFDVPIELAEALTGFRHDVEFVDDPFEVLKVNATIAAGVGFRLRRVVANIFGKLVLAAVLAVLLFGIGVALFIFLALIVTIVQHLV